MAMPRKLKHFNLFNEGNSYMGVAKSITLPKMTRKLEAWRGAGMDGPVKVDLGHGDDGIPLEWTLGGWDLTVLKQFGAVSANGIGLRFAGSVQQDDTAEIIPVEVVVRGRHEEVDFGESGAGEDTEHKISTACSYYKLVVDGEDVIEIDLLAMIFIVDGVDMLEEHRKNIGL